MKGIGTKGRLLSCEFFTHIYIFLERNEGILRKKMDFANISMKGHFLSNDYSQIFCPN